MKRSAITRVGKSLLFNTGIVACARAHGEPVSALIRVLAYHSVAPAQTNYCKTDIRVDPPDFERQMAYLARHYRVLPLDEAIAKLTSGRSLPAKAVAITFDDGYRDNYEHAFPVLRRWGLPATFFVVSAAVSGRSPFWVAQLQLALMSADDLAPVRRAFAMPANATADDAVSRQNVIDHISVQINRADTTTRAHLLECAYSSLGFNPGLPAHIPPVLTPAHLREMAAAGMTIGSHSATHPILTSLDQDTAEQELLDSKRELESMIERPVDHFAFPNGPGVANFSAAAARLVSACGYRSACTSFRGMLKSGSELFAIPRLNIGGDVNRAEFAFKLEEHKFSLLLFDNAPSV